MNNLPIDSALVINFMGVLFRIIGIFIWLPMLGDRQIPPTLKIAFAFMLTVMIYPLVSFQPLGENIPPLYIVLMLLKESLIGLVLGFIAKVAFHGVLMAAQFVGYQMGFGMANLLDPSSGAQVSPLSQFKTVIATAIFITLNFHHVFIHSLQVSFHVIPLGELNPSPLLFKNLISFSAQIFIIGIKLAAPILTALVFTMFALGMIARTVPQVNVFVLSFPISFLVGFIVFLFSMRFYTNELMNYFNLFSEHFVNAMSLMAVR